MKKKVKDNKLSLDQTILMFCAFRYALGCHTYVVGSVARTLIDNYANFCQTERDRYVKEIDQWYFTNIKNAKEHPTDTAWWMKVESLFRTEHRIKVKAYCPAKSGIVMLYPGDPMPPIEINKKIKPEIQNAVVYETMEGIVEYWNYNMTAPFYYAEPVVGSHWD